MGFILPINKDFNQPQTFHSAATDYLSKNWSIIPVWGPSQSEQFKVAAIRWSPFTERLPNKALLDYWFRFGSHQGIAIVTGRVSGIAVLDFDCNEQFKTFSNTYPELTDTYTVKTPRGYHLYYQISKNYNTKSMRGEGIDWQWNKRYVLAPPTQGYSIQNSQKPRLLAQADIRSIEHFISPKTSILTQKEYSETRISKQELIGLYKSQATIGNRNNTLFQSSLLARDKGWSLSKTVNTLADLHSHNHQNDECYQKRYAEAQKTIQSAYSRPPRTNTNESIALPNTIKENLCQQGLTAAVRVIEGLRLLDYQEGEWICRQTMIDTLKGIVGEWSIIKALTATLDTNQQLFRTYKNHKPPTQPFNISKCNEITYSKPHFSSSGRKTHFYQLPSNAELAERLGIPLSIIADEINLDDLTSAKKTRQAMYRAYIKRRPGHYPSKWLAKRLGVSVTTKNRYDNEIPDLHKRTEHTRKLISWHNLNDVPDFDVGGYFLEDCNGKRYPAKRGIAYRLLGISHSICLVKQDVNYYWIAEVSDSDFQEENFDKNDSLAEDIKHGTNNPNKFAIC